MQKGNIILYGDLNAVMDASGYVSSSAMKKRQELSPLSSREDLFNPWHHTAEKDFSYYSAVHISYLRIDMFLMDKYLLQWVTGASIHHVV